MRGQDLAPDGLSAAQHLGEEMRGRIVARHRLRSGALRGRGGAGDAAAIAGDDLGAAQQDARVDAGEIADDEHNDNGADAEAARPAAQREAAAARLAAPILDIARFGRVFRIPWRPPARNGVSFSDRDPNRRAAA